MNNVDKIIIWVGAAIAAVLICGFIFKFLNHEYPQEDGGVVILRQGEWLTTTDGRRVCRISETLYHGTILKEGWCSDWQPGFEPAMKGSNLKSGLSEGWVRNNPSTGVGQFHTERGWVP